MGESASVGVENVRKGLMSFSRISEFTIGFDISPHARVYSERVSKIYSLLPMTSRNARTRARTRAHDDPDRHVRRFCEAAPRV